jgi:predicted RNA-binding Zn-ribbon protein involved in translation (DUF1610 family)
MQIAISQRRTRRKHVKAADKNAVCPLCSHDGPKQSTLRPQEFPESLKGAMLMLFKCPNCGTIFADAKAEDPFEVLERTV